MANVQSPAIARPQVTAQTGLSLRARQDIGTWLSRLLIIFIVLLTLIPTVYVTMISFKAGDSYYSDSLIPSQFTLDHYTKYLFGSVTDDPKNTPALNASLQSSAAKVSDRFKHWVLNSAVLGFTSAVLSVLFQTLGAYAFSRFRFRGRKYGILLLLLLGLLPQTATLIAIYRMFQVAQLLNTLHGLILFFSFSGALGVWLLKNYMDSIPKELDEAATVDGASPFRIFYGIVVPLIQPMLVAQFIMTFIGVYNEYAFSSIFISSEELKPLGVAAREQLGNQFSKSWTDFAALAVLGSIPILVFFLAAQRLISEGLTKGALKG